MLLKFKLNIAFKYFIAVCNRILYSYINYFLQKSSIIVMQINSVNIDKLLILHVYITLF